MKSFVKEFKEFIIKGDMMSLAIGVLVANAFSTIVNAFTEAFLTPLITLGTNGVNFSELSFTIGGAEFLYGNFINAFISFLITGIILFLILKSYNKLKDAAIKKEAVEEEHTPTVEELLIEIRDELKGKN